MTKIRNNAQALLELAVFGSLFLMLLAILISYGLKYNYQQQLNQAAFRNALKSAEESMMPHKPSAVTYVVVQDKHIPDPSNPFGIGSVIPLSASASVTRSYQMQHTPDFDDELPVLKINISGKELGPYTTAGFSIEGNIQPFMPEKDDDDVDVITKYQQIYGSTVEVCQNDACTTVKELPGSDKSYEEIKHKYKGYIECIGEIECVEQGERTVKTCPDDKYKIIKARFMDSCAGQIMDYDSAVSQCRQIIDKEVCRRECERNKSPYRPMDCAKLCGFSMNVPKYCKADECPAGECTEEQANQANHKYTFTRLNEIFKSAGAAGKMGLAQDSTKTTTFNTTLVKEGPGMINVSDIIDWEDTTERKMIYYDQAGGETKADPVDTTVSLE